MKQESKRDIVKRLRESLTAQQRSVPQLPAQARAKKISVLGSKTDPKHPFDGYMVGADESAEPGKKGIGPDMSDPYEQGWFAGFNDQNPYAAGTPEHGQWQAGQDEKQAQPNHYDESALSEFAPGPGRDGDDDDNSDDNYNSGNDKINTAANAIVKLLKSKQPVFFQSPDGRLSQIRKISPLNVSPINQDADGNIIGTAAFDIVSKSSGGRNYLDQVAIQPDMYGIVPVFGKKIVMQVADQNLPPHLKRMRDTDGDLTETVSPFSADHREIDQFVKEEFSRKINKSNRLNESAGAVTAHGYAYNQQDQRVAWTKEFASEAEAKEWARRRNATVLSIVPKTVNENNPAADWPDFGKPSVAEAWSQKYKSSINCSHPKGFSQKAHCAGKKKHNESVEMEMVCEDCGMCETHGNVMEIKKGQKDSNGYTKCWPGKHAEGTKKGKNGGPVRNCVPNESVAEGAFDIFKKLPPSGSTVKIAGRPVEISYGSHGGEDNSHVNFSWNDTNGKEHYVEARVETITNLRALAKRIKSEMDWVEQQNAKQGVAENWSEPLAGWHVVYARTGNKVSGTPDFDSRDSAQKYLMTKMSANHHNFRVAHADQLGTSAPTPLGGYLESKGERNEMDTPAVQAALKNMSDRHKNEKWSKEQLAALGKRLAAQDQKPVKEAVTKEDIITKLNAKLGDYLSNIGQQIKNDPTLQNKLTAKTPGDQVGPPVKTLTTDDGHEISIHGNEDDGFRVSIKNKQTPSKFDNLDEAVMACEMYCAHRRKQALNADYIDEA